MFTDDEKQISPSLVSSSVASPKPSFRNETVDRRRVMSKLDWHLLPFVSLLYLMSFLDRTNIGNAKVAGLAADLGLTGLQYNLCSAIFFIPYCFFEVPSNMAMKLFKPSRWIPLIMFLWGIVMLSMAFVKNFSGLLAARIFLGVAESGLFPGVTFYLCLWYPRAEQAQRVSFFLSAATVAGAFGGIFAFGIEKMNGIGGLAGWSWIFLLEGLLTSLIAIISYFFMHDYPETATFLTETEREWLVETIRKDTAGLDKTFKWKFLFQALKDPHSYMLMATYIFIVIPTYALALFLPTIISGLGYSEGHAQLLAVPPYVGGCVFTILSGVFSDRWRVRGPFVLASALTTLVGYVVLYATTSNVAGYIGTVIAACGIFPAVALVLAWTGGNVGGDVKRGVVIAMVIGVGNLGGIASSFIYRPQDSPRYHPGHATVIGCLCIAAILSTIGMLEFSRLNKQKEAKCIKEGISADKVEEFREMGDQSPLYRSICLARQAVAATMALWLLKILLQAAPISPTLPFDARVIRNLRSASRRIGTAYATLQRSLRRARPRWDTDIAVSTRCNGVLQGCWTTLYKWVQLPAAITSQNTRIWRRPSVWADFALARCTEEKQASTCHICGRLSIRTYSPDPPPSMSGDADDLNSTVGALLIGGSASPQCRHTFGTVTSREIPRSYVSCCLDVCHISLSMHMIYYYLVLNYYHPEALSKAVWSFDVTVVVTAVVTVIAHCFYAKRVYILSNRNLFLPIAILLLSAIRLAFGVVVTVRMFQIQVLDKLPKAMAPYVGTGMGAGSVADCIITGALVHYLRTHRSGFSSRTDNLLDKLTYWTVNCGVLTSTVGIAVIICFVSMPDNMIYLALHLLLSKLYANALLATLNFRKAHRGRGVNDEETSIPLTSLRVGSDPDSPFSNSKRQSTMSARTVEQIAPVVHVMTTTHTDAPDADGMEKAPPAGYPFVESITSDKQGLDVYKQA
ncbi:MFS general substrate transporter [Wolfiporia cocos MD-104 SS10]|uniref:MFS general substrate transporter n=1 Tax=Wolfiporia cocos (strain MD-104) TaxID=742152 RepID=A0A2H3JP72_WOLCO|nr:MFS general substrate transporter [Wolfiporia cocos MD-104 SS10]